MRAAAVLFPWLEFQLAVAAEVPFVAQAVRGFLQSVEICPSRRRDGARALHEIMGYLAHFRAFVSLSRSSRLVHGRFTELWLFHISSKRDKSVPRALGRTGSFHDTMVCSLRSKIASGIVSCRCAKEARGIVNGGSPDVRLAFSARVSDSGFHLDQYRMSKTARVANPARSDAQHPPTVSRVGCPSTRWRLCRCRGPRAVFCPESGSVRAWRYEVSL